MGIDSHGGGPRLVTPGAAGTFDVTVWGGAPPRRLFYWCHTTHRQPFETGIPRVVRRLGSALARNGIDAVPIGREDRGGLVEVIGRGPAAFDAMIAARGAAPILLIPDLTVDLVAIGADPICIGQAYGMRTIILVHDLIPLKLGSHYAAETVAAFTAYFESVARADAVLATTDVVAHELRRFLQGRALRVPPIGVVPLPAQLGDVPRVTEAGPARRAEAPLRLASVGSWERRKNLPALLRAMERARPACRSGLELTLVGRRGADPAYDAEVEALLAETRLDETLGVTVAGSLPDAALAALIASCDATVYPSFEEGFGLPVGESLWLGRPCLCHDGSAMAETAPGGGTLMVDMRDEAALADALASLAEQPALLARLANEAIRRPLTSWLDYAGGVAEVLDGIDPAGHEPAGPR